VFWLYHRCRFHPARSRQEDPAVGPDLLGDPKLRNEIAAYLGLARGIRCSPSQVFVMGFFAAALGLATQGLQLEKTGAWIEDPVFPLTRSLWPEWL
jgi:GntR family transcriptional regulator / MocR family aminotransferase